MGEVVQIVGTGLVDDVKDMPHRDMLFHAVREAFDEAGVSRHDVHTAATISSDLAEGRGLSNQFTLDSIGGVMRPFDCRTSSEGLVALAIVRQHLTATNGSVGLVAGVWRGSDLAESDRGLSHVLQARLDPVYSRPIHEDGNARAESAAAEGSVLGDAAVAVVLNVEDRSETLGANLEVKWATAPGWGERSLLDSLDMAASAVLPDRIADEVTHVEFPTHFGWAKRAFATFWESRLGTAVAANATGGDDTGRRYYFLLDGVYRLVRSVRSDPGGGVVVHGWQGPASSTNAVAVLNLAGGDS